MASSTKRKRSDSAFSAKPKESTGSAESRKSVLADDSSFPRGGGSVLTPIEIKQASNEAVQDVLFSVCFFAYYQYISNFLTSCIYYIFRTMHSLEKPREKKEKLVHLIAKNPRFLVRRKLKQRALNPAAIRSKLSRLAIIHWLKELGY